MKSVSQLHSQAFHQKPFECKSQLKDFYDFPLITKELTFVECLQVNLVSKPLKIMHTESHRTSTTINGKDIQYTYYCSDEGINRKGEMVWLYVESDELDVSYLRHQVNMEMAEDPAKVKQEAETMMRQHLGKSEQS